MKPISDLFDGLVVFVSQGTVFKDPRLAFNIANHGGLVVRNVNNKVRHFYSVSIALVQSIS
jgi:hypothetical protein